MGLSIRRGQAGVTQNVGGPQRCPGPPPPMPCSRTLSDMTAPFPGSSCLLSEIMSFLMLDHPSFCEMVETEYRGGGGSKCFY